MLPPTCSTISILSSLPVCWYPLTCVFELLIPSQLRLLHMLTSYEALPTVALEDDGRLGLISTPRGVNAQHEDSDHNPTAKRVHTKTVLLIYTLFALVTMVVAGNLAISVHHRQRSIETLPYLSPFDTAEKAKVRTWFIHNAIDLMSLSLAHHTTMTHGVNIDTTHELSANRNR